MDADLNDKWFSLSLVQQMINIGNEVKRALKSASDPGRKNMFLDKGDYSGEHNLACTGEQINRYYKTFQYLLPPSHEADL